MADVKPSDNKVMATTATAGGVSGSGIMLDYLFNTVFGWNVPTPVILSGMALFAPVVHQAYRGIAKWLETKYGVDIDGPDVPASAEVKA